MNAEEAVLELLAAIDTAARAGDFETSLQYATEDVIHMPPDQLPIVGKDAVRAWQRDFFSGFSVDMKHEADETVDCGEVVVHRGRVTGTMTPKAGADPIHLNNKYLFVLRKASDGTLKVWRAMFNGNTSPQDP